MKYYLAIDIGASGGRHILGSVKDGKMITEEVYRFKNRPESKNGGLYWNTDALFFEILQGLKKCAGLNKIPQSVAIDTWGVDYALLGADGKLLREVFCYRDSRTANTVEKVHSKMPPAELYAKTGIAFNTFNTVYQLYDDLEKGLLNKADEMLFLPDYFNFLLTGEKRQEYTNATTSGMVSVKTDEWDLQVLRALGYNEKLFKKLSLPGTFVGNLLPEIIEKTGFDCRVVLPCTHDTASAVVAALSGEDAIYISSGTWSLIGVETDKAKTDTQSMLLNYTNEGGYQYKYRYLKNITGLWVIQSLKREFADKYSFDDIVNLAKASEYEGTFNINASRFLHPQSMKQEIFGAIASKSGKEPKSDGELFAAVYNSLAKSYAVAASDIETLTGKKYTSINIVGGGSKDIYLSGLTAQKSGRSVFCGPVEATAIGNLAVQMIADCVIKDRAAAREIIKDSFEIKEIG